ncbi:MAG TPA: GntR family transcriptional regulator [Capsulimonadaceae bacterium]|jgi:DNA-binding LacI/PurR family transcriptional regulator
MSEQSTSSREERFLKDIRPKYKVIQDMIREGIADGSLLVGGKLPAEQDLARSFGVAYMTIRAALNELVADGDVVRIHGKGTFVRDSTPVVSTSTGVMALVLPSLDVLWSVAGLYYYPSILQGFCATATRLGFEPTVIGSTRDVMTSAGGELANISGAACMMISPGDEDCVATLRNRGLPVVAVNRYAGRRSISYTAMDQAAGIVDLMRLIAAKGHRRIAFLPGVAGNLSAEERRKGFVHASRVLNLTKAFVCESHPADYSDLSGVIRTRALLDLPHPPTAIVTAGDLIAAGVLQAARERGISVPGDLSVAGFGDFEIAAHLQPSLTTVRLPLRELGARAAELLAAQISGGTTRKTAILPTTVVERATVATANR